MIRARENKEILIEANTKQEIKDEVKKYRALGYKKNGPIEKDHFEVGKPYFVVVRIKNW